MIVHSGYGFLGIAIPLGCAALNIVMSVTTDMKYESLLDRCFQASLVVGITSLWFIGWRLNGRPARLLKDPETGEEFEYRERHTLFWIPLQYWSFIWPLLFGLFWLQKHWGTF